jgi:hypothetical protein
MREGLSRRFVPNHFGGRFRKTVSRYFAKPNHRGYGGAGIVSFPAAVSFFPQFLPLCVRLDASWSGSSPPTDR